eukprot:CAMPEP_0170148078 /NCGR_PEP_ID=MMETSP0033_2-20121228/37264_1 /TAXON_ID=195969 /ORGANISM="Dolichomastix tenuilepis, Strain CCMP3274" /LENGTH=81 /DNA_ID=CAMNT_0010384941 /DNA_START=60 /DNA_END=301 /DNA_ORIENTATION=+
MKYANAVYADHDSVVIAPPARSILLPWEADRAVDAFLNSEGGRIFAEQGRELVFAVFSSAGPLFLGSCLRAAFPPGEASSP